MFSSLFRLIRLAVFILLLLVVVLFTISNRGDLTLSLYPLPFEISLPTYLFFLLTLASGYLLGMLSNGISTIRHKNTAKKSRIKADALSQEVASLRSQQQTSSAIKISKSDDSS